MERDRERDGKRERESVCVGQRVREGGGQYVYAG